MRYKERSIGSPARPYSPHHPGDLTVQPQPLRFCDMYDDAKRFASCGPWRRSGRCFAWPAGIPPGERVFTGWRLTRWMRKTDELLEIGPWYTACFRVPAGDATPRPESPRSRRRRSCWRLREGGLKMVYMGSEFGCDAVRSDAQGRHTAAAIVAVGRRPGREPGSLSVTAISGLAAGSCCGTTPWTPPALSAMKPEYIGLLTLMVEPGTPLEQWVREGSFQVLGPAEILQETAPCLLTTSTARAAYSG